MNWQQCWLTRQVERGLGGGPRQLLNNMGTHTQFLCQLVSPAVCGLVTVCVLRHPPPPLHFAAHTSSSSFISLLSISDTQQHHNTPQITHHTNIVDVHVGWPRVGAAPRGAHQPDECNRTGQPHAAAAAGCEHTGATCNARHVLTVL